MQLGDGVLGVADAGHPHAGGHVAVGLEEDADVQNLPQCYYNRAIWCLI